MKLEELRHMLREPTLAPVEPDAASSEKKGKARRERAGATDFGISFRVAKKRKTTWLCKKCGKKFTPDPKLGYVPSVCAGCDSYV